MTEKQKALAKLRERASRERGRMAELGLADELTDEMRSEFDALEAGVPDLERQLRAAQIAVEDEEAEQREAGARATPPELDAEARELRSIRDRLKVTNYLTAALEQRAATGAEKEYLEARKIPLVGVNGICFPLELLAPDEQRDEQRATTDTDTTTTPRRWLDRLFADTAIEAVGITRESVPMGVASFPVTSAGASAAQRGREEAAAAAAWTVGVTELKPTGNRAHLAFTNTDAKRIPGLESALTRDLRRAMREGIDRAAFLGDAGANENEADITGLNTAAITEVEITQANKVLGPGTLGAFTGLVDGRHAGGLMDLMTVSSIGAWRLWEDTIVNAQAENQTLAGFLRTAGLRWKARGEIETDTAAGDFAAFVGRGRGIEGAGVMALWEAGELIRDPYSAAASGQIQLTLCYEWAFGLPRPSNFARVKFVA